jgi:putative membrane-bound dehydrogenase-like protein
MTPVPSRLRALACLLPLSLAPPLLANEAWQSRTLLPDFHAEGAAVGDLNGDGVPDLAYGPFWFAGPDFAEARRFTSGEAFVAEKGYSDNFFSFIHDIDGDGHPDILVFGFPGKEARLYLNPGDPASSTDWRMFPVAEQVANESPHFVDLVPGGLPEIVCARANAYGFYEAGEDPTQPWTWHAISETGEAATPFGHGLGVGDLDGDGRLDLVEKAFWYQQPADPRAGPWQKHKWAHLPYGGGGAQILVHDFDGDGQADIVTSYNAHGYGLGWFRQYEPGKFERHDLMGESSTQNPFGLVFSQMHALALADIDGDGRFDFVTGKRHYAHQGRDPGGLQDPVLYWFRNTLDAGGHVEFVPHFIHRGAGVGVELKIADLDGDGRPDLVSSSKKGLAVHLQKDPAALSATALERWKAPEGRPQEGYGSALSPQEALARMEAPEGFSVDLVAAEPDVAQPIAMTFDARGRLWVVEGHTYPVRDEGNYHEGKDRILIFEDADGDGSFETRKVFAENINLASGIAVGFGGVYVGAAPYLLFYPDKDQNDLPDGEPEILLDGWGWQDTHETLNAFTWGPDGWLYGCHGVFTHSKVGKPGTPDELRQPINAGVWRFHPVTREFEVYAHGTSNPWGLDFDARGDFFVSACVIPHFYHLSQGGRYQRQAGQHFNPHTFDDIKTIADHAHYTGELRDHAFWGANKDNRPPSPADTSALGGGHAHCGLVLYQADAFPPQYRGDAFFHNLHGHRIVRETIERDGSGHVVRHRPDFVLSNHHDHIGVGILLGPDGAIYFSDWTDPQTCHHRDVEIWDRSNGRLFRVRYGDVVSTVTDLPDRSDTELVAMLGHANAFHSRQAQRLLQERAAAGTLDRDAVESGLAELEVPNISISPRRVTDYHIASFDLYEGEYLDSPLRLRALWTRHVCGLLDEAGLLAVLDDPEESLRAWAVTLLGEKKTALSSPVLARLETMANEDYSLFVRRHLASLLQRLPLEQRWTIAEGLIGHARSTNDRNIPLLCWYGIEPLFEADPMHTLGLVNRTPWPNLKDFLTRRAALSPEGRDVILTFLAEAKNPDEFAQRAGQLLASLASLPPVERPAGWDAAKAHGKTLAESNPAVAEALARLGARFADPEFFPHWRDLARDGKQGAAKRIEAIELLTAGRDPELGALARELIGAAPLRAASLAALRLDPGAETAKALVARLADFPLELRNEAINLIATRPDSALVLLRAVDARQLSSSLVSPVLLDQFARFGNTEIDALIERNWIRGGAEVDLAQLAAAIEAWKKKLGPAVLAKADASRGRQTYATTCGTCHTLFGQGVALGPDLTGSNRGDLAYVLENVLAPNAVVGKDYLLHVFSMKDGSTLSGMVRGETADYVQLALPGGAALDVKLSEVAKREELPQSLMPAGLFEALPLEQVADLVKYLASPSQVPLPGEAPASAAASAVPPPGEGVVRVEGEALVGSAVAKGGNVRAQGMAGFGPGWTGNSHLWWTGGQPGDVLTLKVPGLRPGTHHVTLFPTTAPDYATIRVAINGQLQEADLYTEKVLPGAPIHFEKVNISPGEPLQIDVHLTGANPSALPRYMFGLDRVEVEPAK